MLSKNNKMINVKVSKDAYKFITTLSKKFGVSVSSFCQDCITQSIIHHDLESQKPIYRTSDIYYQNLAKFINNTYDERRKY